ncbi:hypothetical protein HPP92_025705 [Vanilla planifolia]|uniref:Uncharacterized protein n=1 Tax=Vanilla planifolia TaxID=51239 RepID=A0A835UBA5_VANPL|nr:hypothetical protein HPP92_025705 [Vanilla planifolia]
MSYFIKRLLSIFLVAVPKQRRFKSADHQAVVNSCCSRLSIAAFQNPAPEAVVYPLAVREKETPVLEEPITFAEMYLKEDEP